MPIVTEVLRSDHRALERLFSRYEATGDRVVALWICEELAAHSVAEEELVYPDLAQLDREQEVDAERDHAEVKALIDRAHTCPPEDTPADGGRYRRSHGVATGGFRAAAGRGAQRPMR